MITVSFQIAHVISDFCAAETPASAERLALKLACKLLSPNFQKKLAECSVSEKMEEGENEFAAVVGLAFQARVLLHERAFHFMEPKLLKYLEQIDGFLWKHEPALEHMPPQVLEVFDPQWIRGFPRHWPQGPRELTEALRSA